MTNSTPTKKVPAVPPTKRPAILIPKEVMAGFIRKRDSLEPRGYALLVGVEKYPHFDGRDLFAGRNDVLALWQVCRRLGYRPQDIRVRTSPRLEPKDILAAEVELALGELHGETRDQVEARVKKELPAPEDKLWTEGGILGEATHDEILAAVQWLSGRLGEPFRKGKGGTKIHAVPGILAYSGHGAQVGGKLVLCPSDVQVAPDKSRFERALSFDELLGELVEGDTRSDDAIDPIDNLTVVLDCCFAATSGTGEHQISPSLTSVLAPAVRGTSDLAIDTRLDTRIFCAAGRDEQAYQALLGGRWHGAFTWAITQALEQWTMVTSGGYTRSTISHVELLFRARMLLEALSFPQHPVLLNEFCNAPVFACGSEGKATPSGDPGAGTQLDSGQKYAYYEIRARDEGQTLLAQVISVEDTTDESGTAPAAQGFKAGHEHWKIKGGKLKTDDLLAGGGAAAGGILLVKYDRTWDEPPPFAASAASLTFPVDPSGQEVAHDDEDPGKRPAAFGDTWAWDHQDSAGHWAFRANLQQDTKKVWRGDISWLSRQGPVSFKDQGYRYAYPAKGGDLSGKWRLSHKRLPYERTEATGTDSGPNRLRVGGQLDPSGGRSYTLMTLYDEANVGIAKVLLVNTKEHPTYLYGKEYWYALRADYDSASLPGTARLKIERRCFDAPPPLREKLVLETNQQTTWDRSDVTPDFLGVYLAPDASTVTFGLKLLVKTDGAGKASATVRWYKDASVRENLLAGVGENDFGLSRNNDRKGLAASAS